MVRRRMADPPGHEKARALYGPACATVRSRSRRSRTFWLPPPFFRRAAEPPVEGAVGGAPGSARDASNKKLEFTSRVAFTPASPGRRGFRVCTYRKGRHPTAWRAKRHSGRPNARATSSWLAEAPGFGGRDPRSVRRGGQSPGSSRVSWHGPRPVGAPVRPAPPGVFGIVIPHRSIPYDD
jgi:hypothetical protein